VVSSICALIWLTRASMSAFLPAPLTMVVLQTYVWQNYDLFPNFPALKDFLAFWETTLDGPLFAVTVAHSKLIKPAELHDIDGVLRLH
jgi:uncharacterized protein Usg